MRRVCDRTSNGPDVPVARGTNIEKRPICKKIINQESLSLYLTILAMGISRMSTAPAALRLGMSVLTMLLSTTVWML